MKYAVIDVETTGLGSGSNKITEIAIVVFDGEKVIDEYHSLVNPEEPISSYVIGLTGIDNDMVAEAPTFDQIADQILTITEDCVFVAHNVNFDYNVISSQFKELNIDFKRKKLCTVRLSRKVFPGLLSYSLGKICSHLEIPINGRHRAKGDTDATVQLLQQCLQNNGEAIVLKMLNVRSGEATLPPNLPTDDYENLPESPGVYYFKDENGHIIYVGKAINIKKRVLSHFYDKKQKEIALCRETASLDFYETGSEFVALLLESDEIKKHYPKYNTAQKRLNQSYGIVAYKNRKGIIQLGYNKVKLAPNPITVLHSLNECIMLLEKLCEAFQLCPKYTQLQQNVQQCSHYKINNCLGICKDEESVESYNKRVHQAVQSLQISHETFIIKEKGRSKKEHAAILIENGAYKGFGFIPAEEQFSSFDDVTTFIELKKDNADIQRIIKYQLLQITNENIWYKETRQEAG
ncbi:exonuclease domain-containing protein [Zhouia sp. PK063]|uniref:exonuclease domain-containing protein n=1 Tax=Zhouia sp. PK063 TaxID=3373602 RepID=UPI0037BD8957